MFKKSASSSSMSKLLFLIVLLVAVGQMTQTMYVPAIPEMSHFFSVQSSYLQGVMAAYLLSYGLSQFVYGPLSDRIGRRPVILIGMVVFLIGSAITVFSGNFEWLVIGSFVQGCGTGCGGAMSRTVTRDCYDGADLHRSNSLISMGVIFSPLLAPVLGGLLSSDLGWRSCYIFLFFFGVVVTLAMLMWFGETLPEERRHNSRVMDSYRYVFSNRHFQAYVLCLIATFSGVAAFEAAAGVLLGSVLKLSPTTVSILFILPLPGYLAGSWLSSALVQRLGNARVLWVGLCAIAAGSVMIIIPGMAGLVTVNTLIGGAFLYFLGAGILFPAATTAAIQPFPNHAGTAGAILGGVQNLGAGLATLAGSLMHAHSQFSLGTILCVMCILVVLSLLMARKQTAKETSLLAS